MSNTKLIEAVYINSEHMIVANIEIEPTGSAYRAILNVDSIAPRGQLDHGDWLVVGSHALLTDSPTFFSVCGNDYVRLAGNGLIVGKTGNNDAINSVEDLTIIFYASRKRIDTLPASENNWIVTEPCGCIYDWNDTFYKSQCAPHLQLLRGICQGCAQPFSPAPYYKGDIRSEVFNRFCNPRCAEVW
jgi:hypothetical protein